MADLPHDRDPRLQRDAAHLRRRSMGVDVKLLLKIGGLGLVGVAAGLLYLLRLGAPVLEEEARRDAMRDQIELERALARELEATLPPADPRITPVHDATPEEYDVVEYEVQVNDVVHLVSKERVTLAGDVPIRLVPTDTRTWTSTHLSFRYPALARVTASVERGEEEGEVVDVVREVRLDAPGAVSIQLLPLGADTEPAVWLERWVDRSGRPRSAARTPVVRNVGGESREGVQLVLPSGAITEAHAFAFDEAGSRKLGVVVSHGEPGAPFEPAERALATLRPESRRPGYVLDLVYLGRAIGLPLDEPTVVRALPGSPTVTVRRRAVVSRTFAGLSFDHPPGLVAWERGEPGTSRLSLTGADVSVSLIVADGLDATEVLATPTAGLDGRPRPTTRTIAGVERRGQRVETRSGAARLWTDAFAFELGGRAVGLSARYDARGAAEAEAVVEQIAQTLR